MQVHAAILRDASRRPRGYALLLRMMSAELQLMDAMDSVQRHGAHRSFGLSASRSQSPSRLIDRINAASAMPGNATIHHSPENR